MVSLGRTISLGLFVLTLGLTAGPSQPIRDSAAANHHQSEAKQDREEFRKDTAHVVGLVQAAVGILGVLGLGATVIYARRAWREAQTSATAANAALKHAEDVSQIELRPWVAISITPVSIRLVGAGRVFKYNLHFANLGKTVARDFAIYSKLLFEEEASAEKIELWRRQQEERREERKSVLMPGETYTFAAWSGVKDDYIPWQKPKKGRPHVTPVVVVTAFYRSEMGKEWHRTDRGYWLSRRGDESLFECIFRDERELGAEDILAPSRGSSIAT